MPMYRSRVRHQPRVRSSAVPRRTEVLELGLLLMGQRGAMAHHLKITAAVWIPIHWTRLTTASPMNSIANFGTDEVSLQIALADLLQSTIVIYVIALKRFMHECLHRQMSNRYPSNRSCVPWNLKRAFGRSKNEQTCMCCLSVSHRTTSVITTPLRSSQ